MQRFGSCIKSLINNVVKVLNKPFQKLLNVLKDFGSHWLDKLSNQILMKICG